MHHGNNIGFFQRIRMKYKVSVLNENTLEELVHWRISALRFFVTFIFMILLILALFSTLILTTPLRHLLPENVDKSVRNEVVRQAMVIDSLTDEVSHRQAYINTFREVVMGNISIDTTLQSETVLAHQRDESLLEKSEKEKNFCAEFEEEEQYNLSASATNELPENLVFMKPIQGVITEPFSPAKNHLGVDIQASPDATVLSVYQGVVLFAGYNPNEGYIIQIIHPQNFISVYKGAAKVLKKSGDIVQTGEVIATMDPTAPKNMLHFEIWNGMQSLNPTNYIVFE